MAIQSVATCISCMMFNLSQIVLQSYNSTGTNALHNTICPCSLSLGHVVKTCLCFNHIGQ